MESGQALTSAVCGADPTASVQQGSAQLRPRACAGTSRLSRASVLNDRPRPTTPLTFVSFPLTFGCRSTRTRRSISAAHKRRGSLTQERSPTRAGPRPAHARSAVSISQTPRGACALSHVSKTCSVEADRESNDGKAAVLTQSVAECKDPYAHMEYASLANWTWRNSPGRSRECHRALKDSAITP